MAKILPDLPGISDVAARFHEIEAFQAEVSEHLVAIHDLYARIAQAAGGIRGKAGRKIAKALKGRKVGRRPRRRGKRTKRGALRAAIQKVLAGGKVMGCTEVIAGLKKIGFKTASEPKVFYNTVYLSLKQNKNIEKTEKGYKLKAGAAAKK